MTNADMICGHKRDYLMIGIEMAIHFGLDESTRMAHGKTHPYADAIRAANDTEQLAEVIIGVLVRLGFHAWDPDMDHADWPLPACDAYRSGNGITVVTWFQWGANGPTMLREYTLPEAQALTLLLLRLPTSTTAVDTTNMSFVLDSDRLTIDDVPNADDVEATLLVKQR